MLDNTFSIVSRDVPEEWQKMVDFCQKEYGYVFYGVNKAITTYMSGKCQSLFFRDSNGKGLHCFPTSKFTQRNPLNRRPLFAW